jgi:hypothetical protein
MGTSPREQPAVVSAAEIIAVAATGAEARPLRRRLEGNARVRVELGGIGLSRRPAVEHDIVLSCGLAGALGADLPTGTVMIPDMVGLQRDGPLRCDPEIAELLRAAALRCGVHPDAAPLVTVDHVVSGAERGVWLDRGYAAVDMESALLMGRARRFGAVRVVLDTPLRELSPAWARPRRAMASPWLWSEALWLARVGPGLCDLVARIVATAFSPTRTGRGQDTSEPRALPVA